MATINCICPPKPDGTARHPNGDTVRLRETLDFKAGLTARNRIILLRQDDPDVGGAEMLAELTEVYLLAGIESWTFLDAKGKPVEVSKPAIRAFIAAHPMEAMDVGDEADALYSEAVIAPLVARASSSSPRTPTDESTSATSGSSPSPRKPSKRSSITTIPTGGTERMSASPAGGYRS